MHDWLVTAVMTLVIAAAGEEGTVPKNGMLVIDLLNMQWWQALGAFVAALGLSPAPWILGLATNRIQFTKTADAAHARELAAREKGYDEQIDQLENFHTKVLEGKDERYADLVRTNERNVEVAEQQKQRGDRLQEALGQASDVLAETNHILVELRQSAEEVTPGG